MYQDRRRRTESPEYFVDQQLARWRWDSHLWVDPIAPGGGVHCRWCGWTPPTEMPLEHAPLCLENPNIKAQIQQIGDMVAMAFKEVTTGNVQFKKGGDKHGRG